MAQQRLDKIIASTGRYSRREVKTLVREGRVLVDGRIAASAEDKCDPLTARISVNGEELFYREHTYVMLHKPAGVLSATEDGRGETVLDLLAPEYRKIGLFPVGRLDKDTEGLLLLTDDGDPLVRLQCMDTRAAVPAQRARKALAIRRAECKIAHIFRELARRRFERRTLRGCAQRDTRPLRRKAEPRHRAADDLRRLCHAQRLFGRRQDTTARKYLRIWIILGKHGITHTALLQVFCCALGRKCSKHSLAARCVESVKAHAAEHARAVFLPRVPIADQTQQPSSLPQKKLPANIWRGAIALCAYQPLM